MHANVHCLYDSIKQIEMNSRETSAPRELMRSAKIDWKNGIHRKAGHKQGSKEKNRSPPN